MVNDLADLLRESAATAPDDRMDTGALLAGARRRVRRRRLGAAGGTALAAAAVLAATSLLSATSEPPDLAAAGVPAPDAPTLRLSDAETAVEGEDYRVLASHTNENLNRDNGQYYDGVTDDGLLLFRDGPRSGQLYPRFALLDPTTGERDQLPDLDVGQSQTRPVDLGEDRLVLLTGRGGMESVGLVAHIFDRSTREWTSTTWPDLPRVDDWFGAQVGPDGRLYVPVPATQGQPPEGGWPTTPDGDADDADAEGDTYRLWSASLTDPDDVREEDLTVGSLAFTDDAMVWTDSTNGAAGQVHVRDLATGDETTFDPGSGDRCNLLSFGAVDDRIVMGQYCGTYDGGVRDDRVQVLDTDGEQVVTLQDDGFGGEVTTEAGDGLITLSSYKHDTAGTYLYDLATDDLQRISDGVSSWATSGPTQDGQFLWNTPTNGRNGMTQHLGELVD